MAAKVRIIQEPDGHYVVQVKKWFSWNNIYIYCYDLPRAEQVAERILNPVVKEYI